MRKNVQEPTDGARLRGRPAQALGARRSRSASLGLIRCQATTLDWSMRETRSLADWLEPIPSSGEAQASHASAEALCTQAERQEGEGNKAGRRGLP